MTDSTFYEQYRPCSSQKSNTSVNNLYTCKRVELEGAKRIGGTKGIDSNCIARGYLTGKVNSLICSRFIENPSHMIQKGGYCTKDFAELYLGKYVGMTKSRTMSLPSVTRVSLNVILSSNLLHKTVIVVVKDLTL